MSLYGASKELPITFATNVKSSTGVYIGGYRSIALEIVTFGSNLVTSTANVYVQGAVASGSVAGGYRRIKVLQPLTATTGNVVDWEVPSTTGDFIAVCDALRGFDYAIVELSNTATAGLTGCKIYGQR